MQRLEFGGRARVGVAVAALVVAVEGLRGCAAGSSSPEIGTLMLWRWPI